MFKNKKNIKRMVVTSVASMVILSSAAFAAGKVYTKQLTATYGRINFNYNGTDVTQQIETKYGTPAFISGGYSYAPVRAIADIVGVEVRWDPTTFTAYLTGNDTTNNSFLQSEVNRLRGENEALKAKVNSGNYSDSDKSISDIEKQLKKDYEDYEKVRFDIRLTGNNRRADLEVKTDLGSSKNKDKWDDLSDRDIERFIEKMVDDIQRDYKDCDVRGFIRDSDTRDDLYTFSKDGTRRIEITQEKNSSLKDVEKALDKKHSDGLKGIKNVEFKVKNERKSEYTVTVEVNYSKYEDEWNKISDSNIESFMDDVQRTTSKELDDRKAEIDVEVKDGRTTLATYSESGKFKRSMP